MKSHCCNLEFPRIFISDDVKFPSRIFHVHLWYVFLKFKFPFVGREKTCFNFYVYSMLISQQTALFCASDGLKGLMHDCNKAVMLYVQRMAGCLFAYIKHVGTGDVHAMCYVKRD